MLIAQITDIHIGFDKSARNDGDAPEHNLQRLRAVLDRLVNGPNRPDLLLLSGDLTEDGRPQDYAALVDALAVCPFPVWPMAGNHDRRGALRAAFPTLPGGSGDFIHYALDLGTVRLVVLDTLDPGRHGGAFCEERAHWLSATLAQAPETPTLIALHHPPFPAGIPWMDTDPREPWVKRLASVLGGRPQVKALVSGHVHRAVQSAWEGFPTAICPSIAPAVGLDLTPIDADAPDNRVLITDEAPGFCLHGWNGSSFVTHVEYAGDWQVFARYDEGLQPMVREMLGERPSA